MIWLALCRGPGGITTPRLVLRPAGPGTDLLCTYIAEVPGPYNDPEFLEEDGSGPVPAELLWMLD